MDLFGNKQEHPFHNRKVFISGYSNEIRKKLSNLIAEVGGLKATTLSRNVQYLITDRENEAHEQARRKLSESGFHIRVLTAEEVFSISEDQYSDYYTDGEAKKKWIITSETIDKRLFQNDKFNPYGGCEIYVDENEGGWEIRQMFGYLGAFANTDIEISTGQGASTSPGGKIICYVSSKTLEELNKGNKNKTLQKIEDYYNRTKSITLNIEFIKENDFMLFINGWIKQTNDENMKSLLKRCVK